MRRLSRLGAVLLLALVFSAALGGCASLRATADGQQNENLTVASTSVAICQILDRLGYEHVVGVPKTSSVLPDRYAGLPTIGAPMTPDYEIIKSLSPDLVLSPKALEDSLAEDYAAAGISSAFLDLSSVEGMYEAIVSLGGLLGCEQEAQQLMSEYESYMAGYKTKESRQPSILLLMAFPDGFYLVSTENSYVGNLVELAGGKNVYDKNYSGGQSGFVSINPEDMVQRDPEMILVYAHYSEEAAFSFMKNEFETNPVWQYYDAVKSNNVYYLPSRFFGMSATLSWTDALDYLRPILYGE